MITLASKELQTLTEPIYHASRVCSDLFDECIGEMHNSNEAYLIIEELRGRFRRWAAYVGAFAVPKASLDARLASHETIKDMVLDLIYMLQQNLRWAKNERSNEVVKSIYPDEENPEEFVGIPAVESAIDRLFVLAVAIRHSARRTHQLRPGSEGRDSKTLCSLLLQTKYPNARKSLRGQLVDSIYTRGMSLEYLQLHNWKLAYQRENNTVLDQSVESETEQAEDVTTQTRIEVHPNPAVKIGPSAPETHPSIVSPSNVVRYYQSRKKPSGSIISMGSMVRDAKDDELLYPSMPKRSGEASYISCPICSDPLKTSTLTEEVWKAHIDQDLEPYVCISEECREPLRYFIHLRNWENHMHTRHTIEWAQRIHTEKWYCDFGHTNPQEFDEKDELLSHLMTQHGQQLTTSQLQGRARRNRRIARRDPFVCPICDCVPDELRPRITEKPFKLLSKHIGQHLKSLSFLSLSYLNADLRDCESTDENSSRSLSRELNSSRISLSKREYDSFDDIPLTEVFDDGTRRTDGQQFSDDPRPMDNSENWEFIPPKGLTTDYEQLRQKLTGSHEELKFETVLNSEYLLDSTGLCLLSLDGGGVRGLSILYVLKALMTRLNYQLQKAGYIQVKPCEVFDLIGGTSTGGLIAIMLGRLEMDVDECITAYNKLMKAVFEEESSWPPVSWRGKVKARFDSKKLKSAVEEVINNTGASATDAFNDGKNRGCRTFVCSAAKETAGTTRLRSYILPNEDNIPATICEAALATSAATSFFNPVLIGARQFVDGALGANNPVDEVEDEAANIWCSGTGDLKPLVKCFVSIGTGNPGKKALEDDMLKFLSKSLVRIATETEETERKFIARWAKHYDEKRYFRFNVNQGLQEVGLAEYKEKGRMEAATDQYLRHQAQKFRLRDCVQNLQQKQDGTKISSASIMKEHETRRIIQSQIIINKACWNVPFRRNLQFVGRASHLHRLENALFTEHQPLKIAIIGLGGVGKTQIALELAYRTKEKHKNCSVFWVPATNAESLQQAFADIGQQLAVPGIEEEQADVKKLVQRHLSQESAGQWLLIVDNVDDMDMWNYELKDCLPKSRQGCIVCTTRSRRVAVKIAAANVVEVSEMDEEMAMQLLAKSLINQELLTPHQDALKLLEQLTFLPLAIVQAAAYIQENGITLSDYLSLLEEQEQDLVDLLSEDFEDEGRYQDVKNPVATTWLLSFDHIRQLDSLAAEYLSFMSCVDPKDIPQSLLPPGPSRKKETDAIGLLIAYSFVSRQVADDALDVHRLVHLATRNWLRERKSLIHWGAKAMQRLEEVFPDDDHRNRSVWRLYLAHARYVLLSDDTKNMPERAGLLWKFAMCLYSDGKYNEAEISFSEVTETRKRVLGEEHPDTLTSMASLASTYRNQGRWKEAEELGVQVMGTRKRVLGVEHPDTLTSMASLASTYRNQGRWKEAEELDVQVMETRKRVLGDEHSSTLGSMNNLALTYRNQGRWKEAEELLMQVMKTFKRVPGEEHPSTLTSMANLASTYRNQGRWKEAEELGVQVMETRKRVLGEEHPDTLTSMANLASTYRNRGRWKEAEELGVQVMKTRKRVLGEEHPNTLTSMASLASTYRNQGRWKEAEELLMQVMETFKRVLGEEHPSTLTSMANLASTYRNQGRWKEAEELGVQVMETRKRVLGEEHPDTLTSMANLASTYRNQGRWKEAEDLQVQVVETRKLVLGVEHPDTTSSLEILNEWQLVETEISN